MDSKLVNIENYQNLANAIIVLAMDDYEKALSILALDRPRGYDTCKAKADVQSNERFFRSAYFSRITPTYGMTAEDIIIICNRRVRNAEYPVYDEQKDEYKCRKCGYKVSSTSIRKKVFPVDRCSRCKELVKLV